MKYASYAILRRLVNGSFVVKVSVDFHVLILPFSYLNPYFRSFQFEQLVVNSSGDRVP